MDIAEKVRSTDHMDAVADRIVTDSNARARGSDTAVDRIVCATCQRWVAVRDVLDLWLEVEAARDLCPTCSCQLFR